MKILAIEDEPIPAAQLTAVLKSMGHTVELVSNAEDALLCLRDGKFRVVVSDWRMPGLDGLDFCRILRARGGDYVYFILLTVTRVVKETRAEALAAGVDDFLEKPVNANELGMRLHVAERILGFTAQVKQLESILPICSYCQKIRDDEQYWQDIKEYVAAHGGAKFSHGICPDCYERQVVPAMETRGLVAPPYPKNKT